MKRVAGQDLLLVGLSHRTAPVNVRQRFAIPAERVGESLKQWLDAGPIAACSVLSTCNRTEVLGVVPDAREAEPLVLARCFPGHEKHAEAFYTHRGIDAVLHLFSVAAGLDSQVLGETEILGQLKRAFDVSRAEGVCGDLLGALYQQAFAVGKRVRRETRIGEGTLSVARAAVELGARVFGNYGRVTGLIVGVGETGRLVATHLRGQGISRLLFINRTFERAQEAAAEFGGEALPFQDLAKGLAVANFVAVSVESPEPVIRADHVARIRGRDRPMVFVDLSIPAGISQEVRDRDDFLTHDLDDLDAIVGRHREEREAEVRETGRIVVEEVHKFLALRQYATFKPVIRELAERFERIRIETLATTEFSEDDPVIKRLTGRFLAAALESLKAGARVSQSEEDLLRRFEGYVARGGERGRR